MSNRIIQDFEPVIIKKTPTKQEQIKSGNFTVEQKFQAGKNSQSRQSINMRKIDNEEIKLPTVPHEMKLAIQAARNAKKWTQEELAKNSQLPKEIIRDYENGKAVVKQDELSKINRALGLNLRKPKPIKVNTDDN